MSPKLYLASDPLGADLRVALLDHLKQQHPGYQVEDLGNFPKYYEGAHKAGSLVQASRAAGGADRAVLCCGTGQGMNVVANKFPSVYAALAETPASAGKAAAINNANVLTMGGTLFTPEDGKAAVDKWLTTHFKEGFEEYEELLDTSMREIPSLARSAAATAAASAAAAAATGAAPSGSPSAALFVDGRQASGWQPIEAMGHDACVWCLLREDAAAAAAAAAAGGGGGTRVRALVRFPAGALEPPHHHTHGHDQVVLTGDMSVTNHSTASTVRLGPWGYLYTPAGQSHTVAYHADSVFMLGFDGPVDILWDSDAHGVRWESDAARAAAEAALPWTPPV